MAGVHLRDLSIGSVVHGHPRLGRLPPSGTCQTHQHGQQGGLERDAFPPGLADDLQTKVIVGYLESIVTGGEFIKAAEAATSKKPVVMLKAGVTAAGSQAASSHTGSLAGADIAYGAAFKRSGVIRADTFEALFDYATAFAMQPLPKGDRVAIITNAGGPGIMAADAVEQSGMKFSPSPQKQRAPCGRNCPRRPVSATRLTCSAMPIPTAT